MENQSKVAKGFKLKTIFAYSLIVFRASSMKNNSSIIIYGLEEVAQSSVTRVRKPDPQSQHGQRVTLCQARHLISLDIMSQVYKTKVSN